MSKPLLSFTDQRPARLLLAYFVTQGIEGRVEKRLKATEQAETPSNPATEIPMQVVYELSIDDESNQERAITIAKAFLSKPNDPKYQQAAWDTSDTSANYGTMFNKVDFEGIVNWRKHFFTLSIVFVVALIYLFMHIGYAEPIFNALSVQYYPQLIENHQWWRLLGPTFMHYSPIHLVMSLCWWWILASRFERTFGSTSLAILFVVSAIIANVAQLLHSGPGFVGMSSVNYGLFGFIAVIGLLRPSWGLSLPKGIIIFLLVWIVVGYSGLLGANISNDLQLFGMISGAVLALLLHQATNLFGSNK